MNKFPEVAIVILNWNGIHHLKQFLPSVLQSTYQNMKIIVGDNASTDGSVEWLQVAYPQVTIIQNAENFGFAGGYNKVLAQIDAEYFVLLNSDVEVTPTWVEPIMELMQNDETIAAAQPKIKSYLNKTRFEYAGAAGGYLDLYGYPFCRGRVFDTVEEDNAQYDSNSEVFWASGATLFIRKKYWNQVGGLDASFFAHMEEIDLCWRLKNLGYRIICCPQSIVYHLGGGTLSVESPYKTYLNFRNSLLMLQKNLPIPKGYFIIFIRLWLDLIALIKFFMEGKPENAKAISKAHQNFFKNFFNTQSKKAIQNSLLNTTGFYNGSIVWDYFVKKKKLFSDILK